MSAPFVYFIEGPDGMVKIGKTTDVRRRLSYLQTATHGALSVIGVVDSREFTERELHELFDQYRVSGEWFKKSLKIMAWIAQNAEPFDEKKHCAKRDAGTRSRVAEKVRELIDDIAGPSGTDRQKQARAFDRIVAKYPHWTMNRIHDLHSTDGRVRVWADELLELEDVANQVGTFDVSLRDLEELKARAARCEEIYASLVAGDVTP